jgi:hypothetical protein
LPRSRKRTISGYTTKLKPPPKIKKRSGFLSKLLFFLLVIAAVATVWQWEYVTLTYNSFFANRNLPASVPRNPLPKTKPEEAKQDTAKKAEKERIAEKSVQDTATVSPLPVKTLQEKKKIVPPKALNEVPAPVQRNIQVEVLNGCGVRGIAARFSKYLRKEGIDVVKTGNYKSSKVKKSQVIDRIGNKDFADEVGNILGIKPKYIYTKKNKKLLIDATIIIGKDYKQLKH